MKREAKRGKGEGSRRPQAGGNGQKSLLKARLKNGWESDFSSALVDTVPALVVVLDQEARVVVFNRQCREATGFENSDVEGHAIWDVLVVPEEAEVARQAFESLKSGRAPNTYESHLRCKNGGRKLISWQNTPVGGSDKPEWII